MQIQLKSPGEIPELLIIHPIKQSNDFILELYFKSSNLRNTNLFLSIT
ncbi:hypothetical protein AQPE_0335 [Aquipluma nitroreducens]|uniref:Uncharacterized protein n=1 Tax=Aquipluma nitroreducens TaxID=2010828 RepID=A0A5K7S3P4_9BACT|nr:hypothetical protein AQPE_0335 [Aquipluma nitroreducens]